MPKFKVDLMVGCMLPLNILLLMVPHELQYLHIVSSKFLHICVVCRMLAGV